MHELSIAEALINQVRRHTPPQSKVSDVRIQIGATRSIDRDSLRFGWQALTQPTALANAALHISVLPWTLTCIACGKGWQSHDPLELCPTCGSPEIQSSGSDVLSLLSLEVDPDSSVPSEVPS